MTDAGGVLAISVTLSDSKFRLATFPAGSTPPAWARPLIGSHAWESEPEQAGDQDQETPVGDLGGGEAPTGASTPEEDLIGVSEEPAPASEDETPEVPAPNEADKPALPPKRGAGSGRESWAAYASAWGIQFSSTATRDDIIDLVEAAPDVPSDQ